MAQLYEISLEAENDWAGIMSYTLENFGEQQVHKYTSSLLECLEDLAKEKGQFKELKIFANRILTKRCQKHHIFALSKKEKPLLIIAVLHEQMDLIKRLKGRLY